MFAPYCAAHDSRVLLPMTSISAIEHDGDAFIVRFSCTCGATGTWKTPSPTQNTSGHHGARSVRNNR